MLGKFKNEDGERHHKMLAASVTESGFQVRLWTEAMVEMLKLEGNVKAVVHVVKSFQPVLSYLRILQFISQQICKMVRSKVVPSFTEVGHLYEPSKIGD